MHLTYKELLKSNNLSLVVTHSVSPFWLNYLNNSPKFSVKSEGDQPSRRSKQSILNKICPEYIGRTDAEAEAEAEYFGCLILIADSLKKTLRLRNTEGRRRDKRGWDGWMASMTQWEWVWASSTNWWGTGKPRVLQYMGSQRVGHDWATELNWNIFNIISH